jgi:phosphatidylinositol 4-kinase
VHRARALFADAAVFRATRRVVDVAASQVLITSSHAALIEVITDAPSIHALKTRLPRGTTLRDHFKLRYGACTASNCSSH